MRKIINQSSYESKENIGSAFVKSSNSTNESKSASLNAGVGEESKGQLKIIDTNEIKRSPSSSSSALSITASLSSTFSAIKKFGFSSESGETAMSLIEDRQDGEQTFDAFMDCDASVVDIPSRAEIVSPKSPLILDSKDTAAHAAALGCIADKNYKKLISLVKQNPSILLCKSTRSSLRVKGCAGGTLLHVLVSQKPKLKKKRQNPKNFVSRTLNIHVHPSVPEKVLTFIIKTCPKALEVKDDNGRLPIHCACIAQAKHLEEVFNLHGSPGAVSGISSSSSVRFSSVLYGSPSKGCGVYLNTAVQFNVMETNVVHILLSHNRHCASVADYKGNLPLHYAATMAHDYVSHNETLPKKDSKYGKPSAEATMEKLLFAYPDGIGVENNNGMLPIHIISSMGKDINVQCLKTLLSHHQSMGNAPIARDDEGDQPLFVALKSGATPEVIRCFAETKDGLSSRLFIERDRDNNNALHVALHSKYPNVEMVRTILNIAPFTASSPDSRGIMPLRRAAQLRLERELIIKMLARDMPIEIGADKSQKAITPLKQRSALRENRDRRTGSGLKRNVVGRSHHHSWWFILVECKDFYIDTIQKFLSEEATHYQIVSLARQIGPDGKSILINCVTDRCRLMFHSLLRFYERYEILLSTNEQSICCEDIVDGVQTFLALDHGPTPFNPNATYSEMKENIQRNSNIFKVEIQESDSADVELSLLSREKSKVILRTYMREDAYEAELKVRENYVFEASKFEQIYHHHSDVHFTHLNLSKTDKLCCIAFERSDHALSDVFATVSSGSRSKKWIEKCWLVMKQIALALKDLHDQGLIHGHLSPSNICKYGNCWKIGKLGTVIPEKAHMRGTFRSCVPPESIISPNAHVQSSSVEAMQRKPALDRKSSKVKFTPWVIDEGKERQSKFSSGIAASLSASTDSISKGFFGFHSWGDTSEDGKSSTKHEKQEEPSDTQNRMTTFRPERVTASAAWDMWGFGLIMAQLLTGRCTHLSNFEKAEDAVIKKLQNYNDKTLQAICNQVHKTVSRDAADLVYLLLQKDPLKRPKSMDDVLQHSYFRSQQIYV